MVRIVSDTSTLYSTTQAKEAGFTVSPLSVQIAGETYREFDEISSERFVDIINQGNMPTSSQPAVGEVLAVYDQYSEEDEILNITMALGLSGTYTGAVAAAQMSKNAERITVLNSRTLCGPHRYLVEQAVEMARKGSGVKEIVSRMEELMESARSFLMPADFAYLRRGGRLSPLVSYVGQAVHLAPILTQTEDSLQLKLAGVRRSFAHAIKYVGKLLNDHKVGEGWRIYISHAGALELAERAKKMLTEEFPAAVIEILPLSPAFITQGGPGCVAVQVIRS